MQFQFYFILMRKNPQEPKPALKKKIYYFISDIL